MSNNLPTDEVSYAETAPNNNTYSKTSQNLVEIMGEIHVNNKAPEL